MTTIEELAKRLPPSLPEPFTFRMNWGDNRYVEFVVVRTVELDRVRLDEEMTISGRNGEDEAWKHAITFDELEKRLRPSMNVSATEIL
jgi:hypothetical protein